MRKIGLLLGLIAITALGAKEAFFDKVNSPKAQWFNHGYYLGSDQQNPVSNTLNKRGHHLCGISTYDFPAVNAGNTALGTICRDTDVNRAAPVVGCRFGDSITYGIDQVTLANSAFEPIQGVDGGAASLGVRLCSGLTDAGTIDFPDASFTMCCDGNLLGTLSDGGFI